MSEYIVTARKWRPVKFEDVVGQSHVTTTLRNAIASNRLAHAYLFSGPRGVGKTTTARLLAKVVNCHSPVDGNPDNTCELCKEITEGRSFDVLEIDGASNRGVDEIRNLRESVRYAPAKGKYKVYIIDEVHMLTKEAFNALLKTLEEPPMHVLFIFATTEIHKVPATILSRCQRFDFRRIAIGEIIGNLKIIAAGEGLQFDDEAFLLIARKGDGSLRDAQSTFDQVVSLCGTQVTHTQLLDALHILDEEIYFRVTDLIKTGDASGGLRLVDDIMQRGYDIKEFLAGLTEHFRNLLTVKTTGSTSLIESSDVYRKRYADEAGHFSVPDLLRLQRLAGETENSIKYSPHPRFKLEADIIQLITLPRAAVVDELIQRIDEMKKKLVEATVPGPTLTPARRSPSIAARPQETGNGPAAGSTFPRRLSSLTAVEVSPAPARATPSQASTGMNGDEIATRWPEFVNEVRQQRISLGSVLDSARLLGVSGNTIRLGCGNDFQASSIKRQREFLISVVEKVFGRPAGFAVEVDSVYQSAPGAHEAATSEPAGKQDIDHPVVKAMMRELGAEPLD